MSTADEELSPETVAWLQRMKGLSDTDSSARAAVDAELGARNFAAFFKMAWRWIDPAHLLWHWHVDLLCDEMEAVARRKRREAVFCIPPRSLKSQILSVTFPAWVWTWNPAAKFITASNEMTLATRDSVKMRALVKSEFYTRRWGSKSPFRPKYMSDGRLNPGVELAGDNDNKTYFVTTAGGHRFSCTPRSNVTGHGADFVICLRYDQIILTDLGPQPIGLVVAERRAQHVLGFDHATGEAGFFRILEFETNPARELVEIETEDGHTLCCTVDHPVWVEGRGYIPARDVTEADLLLTCLDRYAEVRRSRVKAIRRLPAPDQTFNVSVEGVRNYFANGILTHNCDDPHPAQKGESEAQREEVLRWWFEAVPTRLNEPDRGVKLVVQQRVHRADLAGECMKRGWHKVVLPAEFEEDHPDRHPRDPRKPGELLHPARFPGDSLERLKSAMGPYATAGQLQQRPVAREGGLFKRAWFTVVDAIPASAAHRKVRRWDLASTAPVPGRDPDWTVGALLSRDDQGVIYIEDIARFREDPLQVKLALKAIASQDGSGTKVRLPEDPGQAGKAQLVDLITWLAGYDVRGIRESGDKYTRAMIMVSQAAVGNIKLLRGAWNDAFLDEICDFPMAPHDDQVDAVVGAFVELVQGGGGMLDYYREEAQRAQEDERYDAEPSSVQFTSFG